MAALQEPFPARWYWNVAMLYLSALIALKTSLQLLQSRVCQGGGSSTWECDFFFPAWRDFAGEWNNLGFFEFATLLVLVAHRANMQHRGL